VASLERVLGEQDVSCRRIGTVIAEPVLRIGDDGKEVRITVDELTSAWRGTLDW
jgi:hypothetical protein